MKNTDPPPNGQALLADFQSVLVSTATIAVAEHEATRSENALVEQLESMTSGSYLQPGALASTDQDVVTRASLDAHIKKVQARQLGALNAAQLQQLNEHDRRRYKGRRVKVTITNPASQPIDIVWFDEQNGYRTTAALKTSVNGTIEDVLLDRNLLVLRPPWSRRLLNNRLQNYLVYVIDPDNLEPMIDISFA